MAIPLWMVYALSTSVLWGLGYVLAEKIMRETAITPVFLMVIMNVIALPVYMALSFFLGQFKVGVGEIFSSGYLIVLLLLAAFSAVGGNILILHSIVEKNAALASLLEISYPLFVVIFSYLILKDAQLNWGTGLGGLLIFAGVVVIYLKS